MTIKCVLPRAMHDSFRRSKDSLLSVKLFYAQLCYSNVICLSITFRYCLNLYICPYCGGYM